MNETVRLGLILLLVAAIAGGVLAFTNSITAPLIAEQEMEGAFGAFMEIFPDADDFLPIDDTLLSDITSSYENVVEIYEVLEGDSVVAYAFNTSSGGYGGPITTISGFNLDGTIAGIRVTENSETPNLGTVIVDNPAFRESFEGNTTSEPLVAVDGPSAENEVMLMTGATMSTNGVVTGVNAAREAFEENFNN